MFTKQELVHIIELVDRASITGRESTAVAILRQKIERIIKEPEKKEAEPVKEK